MAEQGYFQDFIGYKDTLEKGQKALEAFYQSVGERDFVFLKNVEKTLADENQKTAVLITGGYHTPHLKQLLKEKGYSYAVVTPVVTSETNQDRYEKNLLAPVRKEMRTLQTTNGTYKKPLKGDDLRELLTVADASGARLSELLRSANPEKAADVLSAVEALKASGARLTETANAPVQLSGLSFVPVKKIDGPKRQLEFWSDPNARRIPNAIPDLFAYSVEEDGVQALRGIFINPQFRGQSLLRPLLDQFFKEFPEVARTHPLMDNLPVLETLYKYYGFRAPSQAVPNVYARNKRFYMTKETMDGFLANAPGDLVTAVFNSMQEVPDISSFQGDASATPIYLGQSLQKALARGLRRIPAKSRFQESSKGRFKSVEPMMTSWRFSSSLKSRGKKTHPQMK
jgi:flagellar motility protein MotE (MotC chaperone)